MSDQANPNLIHTRIWRETPEANDAFATASAHCHGYDVYGAMLGQASYTDMVYLMLRGEAPTGRQARLFEAAAVALANPGPRDPSVHAAMCGGVCGSTAAATLVAALSVGAGASGGAREVLRAMQDWEHCGVDLDAWRARLAEPADEGVSIWPGQEHAAGYAPHGVAAAGIVSATLDALAGFDDGPCLPFLQQQRAALEAGAGHPLAMTGVAACALHALGFTAEQGEMLFLLLRLPGAAAHALEQRAYGFRKFPFYTVELTDDPRAAHKEAA
jgi:citrate synthase